MPPPASLKYTTLESGYFRCDDCNMKFRSVGYLANHWIDKHAPPDEPYRCAQCGKEFETLNGVAKHVLNEDCEKKKKGGPSTTATVRKDPAPRYEKNTAVLPPFRGRTA